MSSAPSSTSAPLLPAGPTRDQLFGACIHRLREVRGLAPDEAAGLAGVEYSEWLAVEEGYVPADPARLHAMAAALEVDWDGMEALVLVCRAAGQGRWPPLLITL